MNTGSQAVSHTSLLVSWNKGACAFPFTQSQTENLTYNQRRFLPAGRHTRLDLRRILKLNIQTFDWSTHEAG